MRLAICAPIAIPMLAEHLAPAGESPLPAGLGSTTPTLLAIELLRRGLEVTIYTLDHDVVDCRIVEGEKLRVVIGPYRAGRRARDWFKLERDFLRTSIQRDSPVLVHAHWSYEFALAALESGIPTLVTVRDWAPNILRHFPDPYRFVRMLMHFQASRKAKWLSAVSPYIQNAVKWTSGKKPVLIPNALKDDVFTGHQRLLPNLTEPRLVSVNNGFSRLKNVKTLLTAFSTIRGTLPQAQLTLLGVDFEPAGPANQWAVRQGLDQGVSFLGPRPHAEVLRILADSTILVHASLEESFGMTLIEAMAKGTPIVAGRFSGAVPWVLDRGNAGVLVDVRSPENIASAAIDLCTSRSKWEEYSIAGFENAHSRFRLSHVGEQYLALYREIMDAQGLTISWSNTGP